MRYAEVLSMAEALATTVIKIAQARHQELALAERPTLRELADEVIRAVALKVAVELKREQGP